MFTQNAGLCEYCVFKGDCDLLIAGDFTGPV